MRQRRLRRPRIGHHPEALVDEALVPELFERPHGALHVGEVHGPVVVVEVDPARRTVDVVLPVGAELHDRGAAVLVEAGDAVFQDVAAAGELQLGLRMQLRRQAVAVPAEPALDLSAAHRLVARHQVLHEAGDDVPVVREPVGEGRPVIEDVFRRACLPPALDRALEDAVLHPPRPDRLLDLREARRGVRGRIDGRLGGVVHDRSERAGIRPDRYSFSRGGATPARKAARG